MFAILCMGLIAFATQQSVQPSTPKPSEQDTAPIASLDGNWTILCVEKDGKALPAAKDKTVSVKNNILTCTDDRAGLKTMKVQFAPKGTIQIWEQVKASGNEPNPSYDEKAKSGTYILTADYLAVCVHDETGASEANQPNQTTSSFRPQAKSHCTMIFKRTDK